MQVARCSGCIDRQSETGFLTTISDLRLQLAQKGTETPDWTSVQLTFTGTLKVGRDVKSLFQESQIKF